MIAAYLSIVNLVPTLSKMRCRSMQVLDKPKNLMFNSVRFFVRKPVVAPEGGAAVNDALAHGG